jgi:hypothetical protein
MNANKDSELENDEPCMPGTFHHLLAILCDCFFALACAHDKLCPTAKAHTHTTKVFLHQNLLFWDRTHGRFSAWIVVTGGLGADNMCWQLENWDALKMH